jgi:hypothetical protein
MQVYDSLGYGKATNGVQLVRISAKNNSSVLLPPPSNLISRLWLYSYLLLKCRTGWSGEP